MKLLEKSPHVFQIPNCLAIIINKYDKERENDDINDDDVSHETQTRDVIKEVFSTRESNEYNNLKQYINTIPIFKISAYEVFKKNIFDFDWT